MIIVDSWKSFRDLISKYAVRAYVFYKIDEKNESVYIRISAGRVGFEGEYSKNDEEYREIIGWLKEVGAVKVVRAVPEDLFFS